MNYAELIGKYKDFQVDVFIYAYLKALEELVGEDKVEYYIQTAVEEMKDYRDAIRVADKLIEPPKTQQTVHVNIPPPTPSFTPNDMMEVFKKMRATSSLR